ncbi:ComF family protein [Actinoalloteichus hymeniacidonis]|uniref:Amidophosphoribosyltransferase n=1 Tax=Actinoalloteichus hymeniacidonis TaxID=340345 RepID=A0AAC9HTR8_9PSEU|nr:ComF family protein [Actinoalloteichus hymeniacidonis]AOS65434.1 putative amidophosphoribosyltransferase [Actinoalloteichus hymeniacidonis]MBB5906479.1 putative amidophosphoribosyltransferase [Actinoalloteichus hymeniacidonis]
MRVLSNALRDLSDLVFPSTCVGCSAAGDSLCPDCVAEFGPPMPVPGLPRSVSAPCFALARYSGAARQAVVAYKERGERSLARPLGLLVAAALPLLSSGSSAQAASEPWLVPAPSRPAVARRRGGNHVERLLRIAARTVAENGTPCALAPCLVLAAGAAESVGLDDRERAANLAGRVRVRPAALPPSGTPVILVDDVLTTGATAGAAITALAEAGVPVASVLALTSAHRDRR